MNPISSSKARAEFFSLIDTVNQSHEPALITGKRGNAVLIAEEDWRAIEETLYLNAIPGMADSIRKGMQTDSADCTDTLDWD
ncbi:MAG: type II toxin-antitoxin system Phd/YefM family antitoxin [Candidatus Puniceispirillaceae bacterium]|jgi:prevent-host-death family protein